MLESQGWGILIPKSIQEGSGGVSHHHQIQAPLHQHQDAEPSPDSSVPHEQWLSHCGDDMVPV